MGARIKIRIVPDDGSSNYKSSAREQPKYPDTGETGETYEIELKETRHEANEFVAMENAAEFLRLQRKQALDSMRKASIARIVRTETMRTRSTRD